MNISRCHVKSVFSKLSYGVFSINLSFSWDTTIPSFPGGEIYSLVAELENYVSWYSSTKTRYPNSSQFVMENLTEGVDLRNYNQIHT